MSAHLQTTEGVPVIILKEDWFKRKNKMLDHYMFFKFEFNLNYEMAF